jgi:hypothetical protein
LTYFQNIRNKAGDYLLLKQYPAYSRKRTIMNIDSAGSIGIIYCGDNPDDVELIKNYVQTLRNMGKQVKSLGFIHVKQLPLGLNGSMMHQYFALKELSWYFKPSSQFINNFVNDEFDILMDFGIPSQLPILFISSMSKAKCKVGRYLEKYVDFYDVMIEADETKNLDYVVKTTHNYMMLLNKKTNDSI